jgi:hypothetical protein
VGWAAIVVAAFEAPTGIADFDDVAVVGQIALCRQTTPK